MHTIPIDVIKIICRFAPIKIHNHSMMYRNLQLVNKEWIKAVRDILPLFAAINAHAYYNILPSGQYHGFTSWEVDDENTEIVRFFVCGQEIFHAESQIEPEKVIIRVRGFANFTIFQAQIIHCCGHCAVIRGQFGIVSFSKQKAEINDIQTSIATAYRFLYLMAAITPALV